MKGTFILQHIWNLICDAQLRSSLKIPIQNSSHASRQSMKLQIKLSCHLVHNYREERKWLRNSFLQSKCFLSDWCSRCDHFQFSGILNLAHLIQIWWSSNLGFEFNFWTNYEDFRNKLHWDQWNLCEWKVKRWKFDSEIKWKHDN